MPKDIEPLPHYAHYLEQYNALGAENEKLEGTLERLHYQDIPAFMLRKGLTGARGFSADAFYFSEAHWINLIRKQIQRREQLQAEISMYDSEIVENMKRFLESQGVTIYKGEV